jgi:hypothetical protein
VTGPGTAETCAELAAVGGPGADGYAARARAIAAELGLHGVTARTSAPLNTTPTAGSMASLRRVGDMWELEYGGRTAYARDVKGLHDLAALLARPSVEIPAIDLAGATGGPRQPEVPTPTLDRAALAAYRKRLVQLADDLADAELNDDIGRVSKARDEREWIVAELRRSTPASPRSCPTSAPTLTGRSAPGPHVATTHESGHAILSAES